MKKTINRPTINTIGADRYFKIGSHILHPSSGTRGVVKEYSRCTEPIACFLSCCRIRVRLLLDGEIENVNGSNVFHYCLHVVRRDSSHNTAWVRINEEDY